ncbi:MAG TPA: response regulator transcription factor [Rubrobacteraceae bacterium]|nr:response regulator transcription factor [Rubrobacteraceae bacterium]
MRGVNVVGQVGSVAEAYQLRSGTDVAVVDLDLPDGDGIELVEKFSSDEPKVATLVLSASLAPDRFAAAVDAGAAGVLHKSASISETVGAVRRLKNGEVLLSPDEVVKMLRMVNRRRREEGEARKAIEKLTRCEKEILQALAEGLDSKQIAQKLHITVETERTHIS